MKRIIEQTVIWATSEGVRCVVARYDEARYQLRLLRAEGTIKADLFASLADANRAANRWRAEVSEHDFDDWPQECASDEERRERGGADAVAALPCASDKAEHNSAQRPGRSRHRAR